MDDEHETDFFNHISLPFSHNPQQPGWKQIIDLLSLCRLVFSPLSCPELTTAIYTAMYAAD
jgi:hypothetical protein